MTMAYTESKFSSMNMIIIHMKLAKVPSVAFPWFSRVPKLKFEFNRSWRSWVILGHTNKQRLLLYIYRWNGHKHQGFSVYALLLIQAFFQWFKGFKRERISKVKLKNMGNGKETLEDGGKVQQPWRIKREENQTWRVKRKGTRPKLDE